MFCFYVAVKVEPGFPVEVKGFKSEKSALKLEKMCRKEMNIDYDETGVFEVHINENDKE